MLTKLIFLASWFFAGLGLYAQADESSVPLAGNDCCLNTDHPEGDGSVLLTRMNVITPNEDGVNDFFCICGVLNPYHLEVFNRWGQSVLDDNDYQNDWPAKGTDPQTLPDGTYFFKISYGEGDSKREVSGDITILR